MDNQKIDKAFIVASGPSAKGFNPPAGIPIIIVNGVVEWIRRADYWVTIDGSPKNIRHAEKILPGCKYFAALPDAYKLPLHVTRLHRISMGESPGLSENPYVLHSGNSAFAALGLAYHLGVKKVALVGIDGTNKERIEGGRSKGLLHLPSMFDSAASQIDMVNCGMLGAQKIPKASLSEAVRWLKS